MVGVYWVFFAQNNILDSDSELSVLVEAWLVWDAHTFEQLSAVGSADALRAFVHVEVRTNSMASAMFVIQAHSP